MRKWFENHYDTTACPLFIYLLFFNVAWKTKKPKSEKKAEKKCKIEPLIFKNIQNVRKFFLNIFLLGFWPKIFLTSMKLIHSLKSVAVNFLKMNAHQKATQRTYFHAQNKNSFIIIHREWRYELFEIKCFWFFVCRNMNWKITFTLNLKYITLWDFISC